MINGSLPMRRDILHAAAAAGVVAAMPALAAAESPPETKRIRLLRHPFDVTCISPMWVAEELLRAEGFDDVSYVPLSPEQYATVGVFRTVAGGGIDYALPTSSASCLHSIPALRSWPSRGSTRAALNCSAQSRCVRSTI